MSYTYLSTLKDALYIQHELESKPEVIAFDVESTGLDFINDTLLLLQLAINGNIYLIDCRKLARRELTYMVELIDASDALKVGHNAKFDMKFLKHNTGIMLSNVYCTMTGESLLSGGIDKYKSLDYLTQKYLNIELDKEVRSSFIGHVGPLTERQLKYGADDVIHLEDIYNLQLEIIKQEKMERVLELEIKLLSAVASMEYIGVLLDKDAWQKTIDESVESYDRYTKEIKDSIWNKVIQKVEEKNNYSVSILYLLDYLNVPVKTKRDKVAFSDIPLIDAKEIFYEWYNPGSYKQILGAFKLFKIPLDSTSEKIISNYKLYVADEEEHINFIEILLNLREAGKKVSSYGEKFIDAINPTTGRLHAEFNQIGTRTGRFSGTDPNLQQVPREESYRKAFISADGYSLATIDYSQQEYRLAGSLSGERKIIDAYLEGLDMHTLTGCLIYNTTKEELTKDQRYNGKTINFAILYGSSEYGLARNLKITIQDARNLITKFYTRYPVLTEFIKTIHSLVLERYYSVTPLGRRRYFEKKNSFDDSYQYQRYMEMLKREGFNNVVQGGSADMLKLAMVNVYYDNPFGVDLLRMVMCIHDEIVVQIHDSILEEGAEFVSDCFKRAGEFFLGEIPPKSDITIAKCWSK